MKARVAADGCYAQTTLSIVGIMELVLLFLVLLGAIGVTAIAQRKGLQPALVIVLVGFGVSFIPGIPRLDIPSEVILGAVLPPLLYSAALYFSFFSFIRSFGPILGLGVGLVLVTAIGVGLVGNWLVAALTIPTAILLGAVVAPPDAVTAVAIGRKLGLPRRVMDVLTGESLVNDAAALTLFTITIATIAGTHTLFANPVLLFLYAAIVGSLIGLGLGMLTRLMRRYLKNAGLETVLGIMLPFAAYFIAERVEASGVLAVVFAGFAVGTGAILDSFETRTQERHVWNSLDVLLEAFVFAYMGLQLRWVISDVVDAGLSAPLVFAAGGAILLTVLVIRPIFVFGMIAWRRLGDRLRARRQRIFEKRGGIGKPGRPERTVPQRARQEPSWADRARPERRERGPRGGRRPDGDRLPFIPAPALTYGEAAVVSWTGMRGVVTIAAASGIPLVTASGEDFPGRAIIQAIAFTVAVGTLLLQGLTLPALIRRVKLPDDSEENRVNAEMASAVARDAATTVIREFTANPPADVDPSIIATVRDSATRRAQDTSALDVEAHDRVSAVFDDLLQRVVDAQRDALLEAMQTNRLDHGAAIAEIESIDYHAAAVAARQANRL